MPFQGERRPPREELRHPHGGRKLGATMMESNPPKVYGRDPYGNARIRRDVDRDDFYAWAAAINADQSSRPINADGTGGRTPVNPRTLTMNPRHRARSRQDAHLPFAGETGDGQMGDMIHPHHRARGREEARPVYGRSGDDGGRQEIRNIKAAREAGTAGPGWNYTMSDEQEFYRRLEEVERHTDEVDVHGQNPPPDTGMRSDGLRDALMELHDRGKIDLFSHMADFLSGTEEDEAGEHSDIHRMAHNWARKNGYF